MWIKDIHGWTDFMDSNRHTCKYLMSWSTNKSPLSPNALQEWLKIKLHFVLSKVYPALVINSHYSFPLWQNYFEPFACVSKNKSLSFNFQATVLKLKPLWNLISFQVLFKKNIVQHFSVLMLLRIIEQNNVILTLSEKWKVSSLKAVDFFNPLKYYNYCSYIFP